MQYVTTLILTALVSMTCLFSCQYYDQELIAPIDLDPVQVGVIDEGTQPSTLSTVEMQCQHIGRIEKFECGIIIAIYQGKRIDPISEEMISETIEEGTLVNFTYYEANGYAPTCDETALPSRITCLRELDSGIGIDFRPSEL